VVSEVGEYDGAIAHMIHRQLKSIMTAVKKQAQNIHKLQVSRYGHDYVTCMPHVISMRYSLWQQKPKQDMGGTENTGTSMFVVKLLNFDGSTSWTELHYQFEVVADHNGCAAHEVAHLLAILQGQAPNILQCPS
jgi:hypothetical protein